MGFSVLLFSADTLWTSSAHSVSSVLRTSESNSPSITTHTRIPEESDIKTCQWVVVISSVSAVAADDHVAGNDITDWIMQTCRQSNSAYCIPICFYGRTDVESDFDLMFQSKSSIENTQDKSIIIKDLTFKNKNSCEDDGDEVDSALFLDDDNDSNASTTTASTLEDHQFSFNSLASSPTSSSLLEETHVHMNQNLSSAITPFATIDLSSAITIPPCSTRLLHPPSLTLVGAGPGAPDLLTVNKTDHPYFASISLT